MTTVSPGIATLFSLLNIAVFCVVDIIASSLRYLQLGQFLCFYCPTKRPQCPTNRPPPGHPCNCCFLQQEQRRRSQRHTPLGCCSLLHLFPPHATMQLYSLLHLPRFLLLWLFTSIPSTLAHPHQEFQPISRSDVPVTVRLLHRNSPRSPFQKVYRTNLEALADILHMDSLRLKEFGARLESSLGHRHPPTTFEGEKRARVSHKHHAKSALWSTVTAGASAGTGQYLVSFLIGTPAQHFLLIADTGSDLVWVRCCRKCSRQPQHFDTRKSTTFSPIPCFRPQCSLVPSPFNASCRHQPPAGVCNYDYVYADLSDSSGIFAYESVTLNSTTNHSVKVKHVAFGCGLKNTGKSFVGTGGVLGLGRGAISFASQLGSEVAYRFSYCFADFFRFPSEDSYLVFGKRPAHNAAPHSSPKAQFTPLLQNPFLRTFYYIGIEHVSVDGIVVPIHPHVWRIDDQGNGGTVIDSGTTLTYFLEPAYRKILAAFKRRIPYPQVKVNTPTSSFSLCFNATLAAAGGGAVSLPQLRIAFKGNATFEPPPPNYFADVTRDLKCLALQGVSSLYGFSVLGNLLQQNFVIEYDRKNEQLSFTPTTCSATP